MHSVRSLLAYVLAGAMLVVLSACGSTASPQATATDSPVASATTPAASPTMAAAMNMFGGPVYSGDPNLAATAALLAAGGGAQAFSFQTALVSMLGEDTVNAEVAKLTKQYGADQVKGFIDGMDFAVDDAVKIVTAAGVTLPAAPADLHGVALAKGLVKAGTAPDGTFWAGYLFDVALSHPVHNQVMDDINKTISVQADLNTHKVLNQAMFDVAQALGMTEVKLPSLH